MVSSRKHISVADAWGEILDAYDRTKRDLIYAYGGASTYVRLNEMYQSMSERECRVILVINAEHSSLRYYLNYAEGLAVQHGLVVFSMCWIRAGANMTEEVRLEEIFRARRLMFGREDGADNGLVEDSTATSYRRCYNDDNENAATANCEDIWLTDLTDDDDFGESSTSSQLLRSTKCTPSTKRKFDEVDYGSDDESVIMITTLSDVIRQNCDPSLEPNVSAVTENEAAPETTLTSADDMLNEMNRRIKARELYNYDRYYEDAVASTVEAAYYVADENDRRNSSILRNKLLMQFFARTLYYARSFIVCDCTGMPYHKTFRLMHSSTVRRWCKHLPLPSVL